MLQQRIDAEFAVLKEQFEVKKSAGQIKEERRKVKNLERMNQILEWFSEIGVAHNQVLFSEARERQPLEFSLEFDGVIIALKTESRLFYINDEWVWGNPENDWIQVQIRPDYGLVLARNPTELGDLLAKAIAYQKASDQGLTLDDIPF